jgi:hypothetical protein
MKNLFVTIKTNKGKIVKHTLIALGTVTAITLIGYAATRNPDLSIDITELPDGGFAVTPA